MSSESNSISWERERARWIRFITLLMLSPICLLWKAFLINFHSSGLGEISWCIYIAAQDCKFVFCFCSFGFSDLQANPGHRAYSSDHFNSPSSIASAPYTYSTTSRCTVCRWPCTAKPMEFAAARTTADHNKTGISIVLFFLFLFFLFTDIIFKILSMLVRTRIFIT